MSCGSASRRRRQNLRRASDARTCPSRGTRGAYGHGWYQSDAAALDDGLRGEVRKLVPKDLILYLHGLHLLEETSQKCARATGVRVLCPAKAEKMWAAALKDACTVNNNAGEAYNHTCT